MTTRLVAAALIASLGLLASCQQEEAPKEAVPRPALTFVAAMTATDSSRYTGTIASRYNAELGFEVGGRLTRREANVGDLVVAGQPLAYLDPLAYQLQLRIAEAELQSATAQLQNAVTSEEREKSLSAQNASSTSDFEAARQARESAAANLDSAQAKVAKAKEQLANTVISATFAGVVTEVKAEPGQIAQAGQTILTIARPDVREAVVDIAERMGRTLRPGAKFDVVSQNDTTQKATGQIREIAPLADSTTRTLRVRITLNDPPAGLRLGTTVTATMSAAVQSAILLPPSAVLERDGKSFVWIVDASGTVATREVVVAPAPNMLLKATKGLSVGDRVVALGVHSLTEGQKVRIETEAAR
jgi:RND family efflux transporter MFP subunit